MNPKRMRRGLLMTILSLGVVAFGFGGTDSRAGEREHGDSLFVGEASDNSIRRFDARTGDSEGTFVSSASGGLNGPRALVFGPNRDLLIVNQNVAECLDPPDPNLPPPGEVLRYSDKTGAFLGKLVGADNPNAPAFPRGMVLWRDKILFVADFSTTLDPCATLEDMKAGRVLVYRLTASEKNQEPKANFLAALTPESAQFPNMDMQFHPRGLVIGPDGLLYVSNVDLTTYPLGGQVLRFDPKKLRFVDVFVSSSGPKSDEFTKRLNRPEGLVFSPHGDLYITGYRNDCADVDKILIFQGPHSRHPGTFLDQIVLDDPSCAPANVRAYGVTMLFGPHGRLFVPITLPPTGPNPYSGSVRRYDVALKTFEVFVPPTGQGGPLAAPWYLTFGNTDPATLQYEDGHHDGSGWDGH